MLLLLLITYSIGHIKQQTYTKNWNSKPMKNNMLEHGYCYYISQHTQIMIIDAHS